LARISTPLDKSTIYKNGQLLRRSVAPRLDGRNALGADDACAGRCHVAQPPLGGIQGRHELSLD